MPATSGVTGTGPGRGQHCSEISIHPSIWVAFEPNCSLFHLSRTREAEVKPNLEIVLLLLISGISVGRGVHRDQCLMLDVCYFDEMKRTKLI